MRVMMIVAVLLAASACIDTPQLGEPEIEQSRVEIKELPALGIAKIDVLIVLDDSVAMEAYRDRLATLPDLVAQGVERFAGSWSDMHVAVASGDGRLRRVPGTGDAYLTGVRDYDFSNRTNYTGTLRAALATMMNVDALRDGTSQPLEAMRNALETAGDFMRDDAKLTVVLVSAADDASPLPVADYAAWTGRLAQSWSRGVEIAAIYPPSSPRLDEYVHSVRSFPAPIDGDLRPALRALELEWGGWGSPCMESEPVRIAEPPVARYDCTMSVQIGDELRSVPPCEARATTVLDEASSVPTSACWALRADPYNCYSYPNRPALRLELNGYSTEHHPAFRFECRTR